MLHRSFLPESGTSAPLPFQLFADSSPEWEYWLGPDGNFRYVSPACAEVCGYPPAAFLADAHLMEKLLHPSDLPHWLEHAAPVTVPGVTDVHPPLELRILSPEGGWRWIEHCCRGLFDRQGRYLGRRGVNRDITRRKLAESEVERLAAVYATLRAAHQAIVRSGEETLLLEEICRLSVSLGGARACVVSIGQSGSDQVYAFAFNGLDQSMADAMPLYANAESWSAWAASAGVGACSHYRIDRLGGSYIVFSFMSDPAQNISDEVQSLFQELINDIHFALDSFDLRMHEEQARYSLKQRQEHLDVVINTVPVGLGVVVRRTFLEVNEQFCAMVGYEAAELIGENTRMVYLDQAEFERVGHEKYAQIAISGYGRIETRMQRKDGAIIDVLLCSAPLNPADLTKGTVFTALDIAVTKAYEQALRDSEARYRMLAENANDIISVHDIQGNCRFITPASKKIVGRDVAVQLGRNAFENIHPEDVARVRASFTNLLAGGDPDPVEYRVRHEAGHYLWVESTASLMMGVADTEVLAITRDISVRKALEAELQAGR